MTINLSLRCFIPLVCAALSANACLVPLRDAEEVFPPEVHFANRDKTGTNQGRSAEPFPQMPTPAVLTAGAQNPAERRGFEPRIRI